jgi:splicing factor 3A subunit 3
MATLLEQTRVTHEEVERLERLIVEQLAGEAHTYRQRLAQSQTVAYLVDQITARAAKLVRPRFRAFRVSQQDIGLVAALSLAHAPVALWPQRDVYEDADGARKEEIAALGGGHNVFG